MIIVLDGTDGGGKTTQLHRIDGALQGRGYNTVCLRDPGGTTFGERIRAIVKDGKVTASADAQMLAFSAARAQLADEVIRPALAEHKIVLLDRWWFSTYAYQGVQGVDVELIRTIAEATSDIDLNPELCFWFDLSPRTSMERTQAREGKEVESDRFDEKGMTFRRDLHSAYDFLCREGYLTRIDAERDETKVFYDVWRAVERHLPTTEAKRTETP